MAQGRKSQSNRPGTSPPPATTPEGRENQLIAAAVNLAEKQLREGTASAQVISYYLKLGSSREKLEQERLANENVLLKAKAQQIESLKNIEKMYGEAIKAMRVYSGHADPEELEELEDD